jgi:hypothetical protein
MFSGGSLEASQYKVYSLQLLRYRAFTGHRPILPRILTCLCPYRIPGTPSGAVSRPLGMIFQFVRSYYCFKKSNPQAPIGEYPPFFYFRILFICSKLVPKLQSFNNRHEVSPGNNLVAAPCLLYHCPLFYIHSSSIRPVRTLDMATGAIYASAVFYSHFHSHCLVQRKYQQFQLRGAPTYCQHHYQPHHYHWKYQSRSS